MNTTNIYNNLRYKQAGKLVMLVVNLAFVGYSLDILCLLPMRHGSIPGGCFSHIVLMEEANTL